MVTASLHGTAKRGAELLASGLSLTNGALSQ